MMTKENSLDAVMRQVLAAQGIPAMAPMAGETADDPAAGYAGALAAPAGPEDYLITVPPVLARDAVLEAKARQWFHRAGLPQGAVSGIVQAYCRQLCCDPATLADGSQQQRTQARLAQEWGADYPRKLAAAQEIEAEEGRAAAKARAVAVKAHHARLEKRLALVEEIEQRLRAVTPLMAQLATHSGEIEQAHAALGGVRPFLPPLAQDAVGGRLAEFMTGCGFADWLPLARPEFRPALDSWAKAERESQEAYRLVA